ncbi:hypothetical protein [Campylobacter sp. RM15925]|uniref:hypothetical protein n=1 Tax=Campylobacter sp. RM15925 TaxID=1705724 RepID=UPI001473EFEA|nr:hypothetical protein [Campylobacter sp. RM15925]
MKTKSIFALSCAVIALFFTGCKESTSYTIQPPMSDLELINLPKNIELYGSNFTLKGQNLRTAEFYLENEQNFGWSKLISVSLDSKAEIKAYKKIFENTLKSGQFGKTKFEFKDISDKEYQGYTIYYPVKGDKNFDNYEINLIQTKKLDCGLVATHYAVKFSSDTNERVITNFIDQKLSAIKTDFPNITCK